MSKMLNLPPHFLFVLVKRDAKAVIMAFVGFFNIFGKVPKMAEKCQILVSAISKDMIGRWRTYSTDILRRFRALSFTKIFIANLEIFGFRVAYAIWCKISRWSFSILWPTRFEVILTLKSPKNSQNGPQFKSHGFWTF